MERLFETIDDPLPLLQGLSVSETLDWSEFTGMATEIEVKVGMLIV
jgi:hypothetical protein